ncbi:MAG: hypothetical protein AAFY28_22050, partial [Actinomycetota bacterium]
DDGDCPAAPGFDVACVLGSSAGGGKRFCAPVCEFGGDAHPSAATLVELAHARALREEWVNAWDLEPIYLRAPDATINWSTRVAGR